ncbi:MAG: hypothetical protein PHH00_00490 [Candidatus Nanoarchaeia archaeon]|nr:hypothetical protein [Candidatus Nanoarchaeia archaeon]
MRNKGNIDGRKELKLNARLDYRERLYAEKEHHKFARFPNGKEVI